ncbi:MAG: hypothetical protein ACRCZE_03325 [Candidatus Altimarinota bacterium]
MSHINSTTLRESQLTPPKQKLYIERPSAQVEKELAEIEDILEGRKKVLSLSEKESEELQIWEKDLGIELEKISELKAEEIVFNIEYFLTEEGKTDFKKIFPEAPDFSDILSIRNFLYQNRSTLVTIEEKLLDDIAAKSIKFGDNKLENQILQSIQDDGSLHLQELQYSQTIKIIQAPDRVMEKVKRLRALKSQLKTNKHEDETNFEKASEIVAGMYKAKINEMLVKTYGMGFALKKLVENIGEENLSESESYILNSTKGKLNKPRTQERLDKFIYGSGKEIQPNGNYDTISTEIKERVATAIIDKTNNDRTAQLINNGLNPELVLAASIDSAQRKAWGERVLQAYGLLSEESTDKFVKTRTTSAEDDKWQYITRKDRKTKSVNAKQKAVFDGADTVNDILKGLIVTCGHEIEGHVIQHVNKSKIPLRLFNKLGGDRISLLAEAGAIYNEEKLMLELFGIKRDVNTAYVLAMEMKKMGGDFYNCFRLLYEITLTSVRKKYNLNDEGQRELFKKDLIKEVKDLIPRMKRIFRGVELSDKSGYLPETKDTVYLEQEIVIRKLKEKGLTKLAYVGGANLKNIADLMHLGLLKYDDIEEPKFVTREIWEEIKDQYQATPQT